MLALTVTASRDRAERVAIGFESPNGETAVDCEVNAL
jgi:hypothetical protein